MSIGEVVTAALGLLGTGGVGTMLVKTWLNSREEGKKKQRDHETSLVERFEGIADKFLEAERRREEMLERHRREHLEDTRKYAESLAEFARLVPRSTRPPSSQ